MLKGKQILLGISGSIAAYKSAMLTRLMVKAGAEVKIIMTPAATGFIAPLTLSTLSKNDVLSKISENDSWANHVMLGRWADIMIIAPLSCNTLAKMSAGLCDNLLLAVYLSATCPVAVAPAMDEDMWLHPSTKNNIAKVQSFGNILLPVENGDLASGLTGEGRMAEPENILAFLHDFFSTKKDLNGKKIMITAGPTHEAIDAVRYIGNHSSGKMGIAIAKECRKRGAEVTLICGPVSDPLIPVGIELIQVKSAAEMYDACVKTFSAMDMGIMSAAVADYTIEKPAAEKIKKNGNSVSLELVETKDILKALGKQKTGKQFLAGFALETNNEKKYALRKMHEKNADIIILNSLNDAGAGFGHETNKITIFDKKEREYSFELKSKDKVASDIVNTIIKISNEQA